MSPADSVRARLSRLLAEAGHDLEALERIVRELAEYHPQLEEPACPRAVLALIASDLHDTYTAIETLFERIARLIDGEVPAGSESHRDLLEQIAAPLPPLRPAVISAAHKAWLHELRSFRHFFRHAYSVPLDPSRLTRHSARVQAHHPDLARELGRFLDFVATTRNQL